MFFLWWFYTSSNSSCLFLLSILENTVLHIRNDMLIVKTLWKCFIFILYNIKTLYFEYSFWPTAFYYFSCSFPILLFYLRQVKIWRYTKSTLDSNVLCKILWITSSNIFCSPGEMERLLNTFLNKLEKKLCPRMRMNIVCTNLVTIPRKYFFSIFPPLISEYQFFVLKTHIFHNKINIGKCFKDPLTS